MRALVAFDKFKDALSAPEACRVAAEALRAWDSAVEVTEAPLSDGGEGFATILTQSVGGEEELLTVLGPRFTPREARMGWVELAAVPPAARELLALPTEGRLAVLEMAQASGLESLAPEERDPWQTSTFGTGQMIAHAVAEGADAILLGIGGSATNDLGLGALEALGLIAYDHELQVIRRLVPARWGEVASLSGLVNAARRFPPLRIACDVTNPLLGERGATAVYGPQKGLRAEDQDHLERALRKQALRLLGLFGHDPASFAERLDTPGAGAAGGLGFGLCQSLPEARFVPGFALVEAWLDLPARIARADLVLTGEGRFDASSLEGKGPAAVLRRATEAGREVLLLAGALEEAAVAGLPEGVRAVALTPVGLPLPQALAETSGRLKDAIAATLDGPNR
jgi:glycerate 2-kinase